MTIGTPVAGTVGTVNGTSLGSGEGLGLPAGLASGHYMQMGVLSRATATIVNTPAGWNKIGELAFTQSHRLTVFDRVAGGSESVPTITQTVSQLMLAKIVSVSGADQTTPLDVVPEIDGNVAVTTFGAPSITPVSAGSMVFWWFSTPDDNTLGSASQGTLLFAEQTTTGSDGSLALVYEAQTSASPTGPCSLTQGANGPDNWCTMAFAIREAVAPAPDPTEPLFDDLTFTVELALGSSPIAPNPTWTDVTAYLMGPNLLLSTLRGNQGGDFGGSASGTMTIQLDNFERHFDPDNAAGPFYGDLVPLVPMRVRVKRDGVTRTLFTGLVQEWLQSYMRSRYSWVELEVVDLQCIAATTELPPTLLATSVMGDGPHIYYPLNEDEGRAITNLAGEGSALFSGIPTIADSFLPGEPGESVRVLANASIFGNGPLVENVRTMELWFRVGRIPPAGTVLLASTNAASNALELEVIAQTDGYISIGTGMRTAAGAFVAGATAPLTVGQHYHVAIVLDSTFNTLTTYVNGDALIADVSGSTFEGGTGVTTITAFSFLSSVVNGEVIVVPVEVAHMATYERDLTSAEVLEHYAAGVTGGLNQTVRERMAIVADFLGLVDSGLYDDTNLGDTTYLGAARLSGSALSYMQTLMQTEQGRMFVTGDGVLTVHDRQTDVIGITENVESQADFGDAADFSELPFTDVQPVPVSIHTLRNTEYVSVEGSTAIAIDEASYGRYREQSESISSALGDPTAGRNLGLSRLRRFAQPASRIDSLVIEPQMRPDDLFPFVLDVELGWKITLTQRPQGVGDPIVRTLTVEGIQHEVTGTSWRTVLYLVLSRLTFDEEPSWVIGDATYGEIGATAGNQVHY